MRLIANGAPVFVEYPAATFPKPPDVKKAGDMQ